MKDLRAISRLKSGLSRLSKSLSDVVLPTLHSQTQEIEILYDWNEMQSHVMARALWEGVFNLKEDNDENRQMSWDKYTDLQDLYLSCIGVSNFLSALGALDEEE